MHGFIDSFDNDFCIFAIISSDQVSRCVCNFLQMKKPSYVKSNELLINNMKILKLSTLKLFPLVFFFSISKLKTYRTARVI